MLRSVFMVHSIPLCSTKTKRQAACLSFSFGVFTLQSLKKGRLFQKLCQTALTKPFVTHFSRLPSQRLDQPPSQLDHKAAACNYCPPLKEQLVLALPKSVVCIFKSCDYPSPKSKLTPLFSEDAPASPHPTAPGLCFPGFVVLHSIIR